MGKRIVLQTCLLGILAFCSLILVSCDGRGLICEFWQVTDESQEVVDTKEQTSIFSEAPTDIETETEVASETETETTEIDLAWEKYGLVSYEGFHVHIEALGIGGKGGSVQIIESYDQLQAFYDGFKDYRIDFGYEPAYFEQKSLVIMIFEYSTGEVFQSLDGIVVKDETLCPVITIDSQEFLCDDMLYCIMSAEVEKEDVAFPAGELLIINLHNPSRASRYHKTRFE